jgi:translation elongation factor EF-1alpha
VPWFRRRDPNAVPAEYQPKLADASAITAAAAVLPAPPGTAIWVEEVGEITGVGVTIHGRVEAGVVRPPGSYRLVPGERSPTGPMTVQVVSVEVRHRVQTEARLGERAMFTLHGVPVGVHPRHLIRKGDVLILAEPVS